MWTCLYMTLIMQWYDMTSHDMIWYDTFDNISVWDVNVNVNLFIYYINHAVMWYDMVWCDVIWYIW